MDDKKLKEIEGLVIGCCKDSYALIQLFDGQLLTTSAVVDVKGCCKSKFMFETENSYYIVSGTMLTEQKETDLQTVYNKFKTILNKHHVTLDLTHPVPSLKRGSEYRSFSDCGDWFQACEVQ